MSNTKDINPKPQKIQLLNNIPPTAKAKITDLKPKEKVVVRDNNKK